MQEAISAVMDYGFNKMELIRQEAFTRKENMTSIRLLERNGLTRDFKLEEELKSDPDLENMLIYAINKEHNNS